jgi:uncharacterized membrane protein YqaE (UPF0057 family)
MASRAETGRAEEVNAGAAAIVAAILLPPLGVFLARGLGAAFWICAALTCIGLLPGMVFALLTQFRPELLPARIAA